MAPRRVDQLHTVVHLCNEQPHDSQPCLTWQNPMHPTGGELLYSGSLGDLPDEHASRRERFAEVDELQPGWTVELRSRGSTVSASFLSPSGDPRLI